MDPYVTNYASYSGAFHERVVLFEQRANVHYVIALQQYGEKLLDGQTPSLSDNVLAVLFQYGIAIEDTNKNHIINPEALDAIKYWSRYYIPVREPSGEMPRSGGTTTEEQAERNCPEGWPRCVLL